MSYQTAKNFIAQVENLQKKEQQQILDQEHGGTVQGQASVEIKASDLCLRYAARIVKDIGIEPSPRWLKERLKASGVLPKKRCRR